MILWLTTLPLTLAESMGWVTVVICFIVAFAVLDIDAMAVDIRLYTPACVDAAYIV